MSVDAPKHKEEGVNPSAQNDNRTLGSPWDVFTTFLPQEEWWRQRSELFERRGYRMRPRFRPGWVPSWQVKRKRGAITKPPEDSHRLLCRGVMDVKRISDGAQLVAKMLRIASSGEEIKIAQMLSEPERRQDAHNHAVPIVDYFLDDTDPEIAFLVMPLLRPFDDPPFASVDEVLDCIRQLLEGLVYLHDLDVAHRDCSGANIMMDPAGLFPKGFHPDRPELSADGISKVKYVQRRSLKTYPRYYFIDFGISTWFRGPEPDGSRPGWELWPHRLVLGTMCQDSTVPEMSDVDPYDPFAVDVYLIGSVIRRHLIDKYSNLEFLAKLTREMRKAYHEERPTAKAALELFEKIVSGRSALSRRWRLKGSEEKLVPAIFRDAQATIYEIRYQILKSVSLLRQSFSKKEIPEN